MCGGGSRIGAGKLRSYLDPPGAVGAWYGSGCFHFSSKSSASWKRALCCLGSRMFLFASKRDLMYRACPLQRYRWTDQSRASFKERRYREETACLVDILILCCGDLRAVAECFQCTFHSKLCTLQTVWLIAVHQMYALLCRLVVEVQLRGAVRDAEVDVGEMEVP